MDAFQTTAYTVSNIQYPSHGRLGHDSEFFSAPTTGYGGTQSTDFIPYDQPFPPVEATDRFQNIGDIAGGNRGRLTRAEVADLEQELAAKCKTKGSHKSDLAQKIRQMVKPNVSRRRI